MFPRYAHTMGEPTYFIGIGAQKAGTTWLSEYFYAHPDVFMSPYKEMHFFTSNSLWLHAGFNLRLWWRRRNIFLGKYGEQNSIFTKEQSNDLHRLYLRTCLGDRRAYRQFLDYGAVGKKAVGEITPSYTDLTASTFRAMAEILPGCRFLLLARNPVDRFLSQARMDRWRGRRRRTAVLNRTLRDPRYRRRGDYPRTLTELELAIDPSRILVVFYEDLFDQDRGPNELKRICDFLGIDYIDGDHGFVVNANRSEPLDLSSEERRALVEYYLPTYHFMQERFTGYLPQSWLDDLALLQQQYSASGAD